MNVSMMHVRRFCFCLIGVVVAPNLSAADAASQADAGKLTPGKSYQIRNKKYGDLLRPKDANSADGTPIVLYSPETWKCMTWKIHSSGESRFQLQNHFTSKTLAVEADSGAAVKQVPFGNNAEQRPSWQFEKQSDGTYKISDPKTGKALSAMKDGSFSSVKVTVQAWQGSDEQKWELIETDPKQLTM